MMYRRLILGLLIALMALSCRDETEIDESDVDLINRVFATGVEHPDDAFVRAETLRILSYLEDPALADMAKAAQDDPSPMVRVAALRMALRSGSPNARQLALKSFGRAKRDERLQVLNAVLEFGSAPLKREITARALRGSDPATRRIAFENGLLRRVDEAVAAKKDKYLERNLIPELARYVDRKNVTVAALALKKFIELGQEERAEPLIRIFEREDMATEERVKAAQVLAGGHASSAEPAFMKVINEYDQSLKDESLGIPGKVIPQELVRAAVLGAAGAGNTEIVPRAKGYLKNATLNETLEILEALEVNPSEDAALALKVAMQDAREEIRSRAIELYQQRKDVDPNALIKAMIGTSYTTQRKIALLLMSSYLDVWLESIRKRLERQSEIQPTLRMLRDVLLTREEVGKVVGPLSDRLTEIMSAEKDERSALAAYLLAINAETTSDEEIAALDQKLDESTRYAFLEFQMRERHTKSVKLFRTYINADLYAMRLVSAAGLWKLRAKAPAAEGGGDTDAEPKEAEEAETTDD